MIVISDSPVYARIVFPHAREWGTVPSSLFSGDPALRMLADRLFGQRPVQSSRFRGRGEWSPILCAAFSSCSQYDLVVQQSGSQHGLPHGLACLAGAGRGFHGQRGRPWTAVSGNIHLTVHVRPDDAVPDFGIAFPLLAAVSVVETLDRLPGLSGRASVKWVNDILIDSAKVAGFVTHVVTVEEHVKCAVLGIGLNVETTPQVRPDAFVPVASCLRDKAPAPREIEQSGVLGELLDRLAANYRKICQGRALELLGVYRERSAVIGRRVRILSDPTDGYSRELASGVVTGIGPGLELRLRGRKRPITHGRLMLLD